MSFLAFSPEAEALAVAESSADAFAGLQNSLAVAGAPTCDSGQCRVNRGHVEEERVGSCTCCEAPPMLPMGPAGCGTLTVFCFVAALLSSSSGAAALTFDDQQPMAARCQSPPQIQRAARGAYKSVL